VCGPETTTIQSLAHYSSSTSPQRGDDGDERARFSKTVPAEILWAALERLFEKRIPTLTAQS
jgi:hypothetical protein